VARVRKVEADLYERHRPNRISSSGQGCPELFKLDQRARSVLRARRRTALNCNPNCNPNMRRPARTLQGMACARSVQAAAWPLVSGRRGCRGSDAQGWVLKIISAKRLETIFGCP